MIDYRSDPIPEGECPSCGAKVNRAGDILGEGSPEPGEVVVCLECSALNVFAEDLSLRRPTDEELVDIAGSSELRKTLEIVARYRADRAAGNLDR